MSDSDWNSDPGSGDWNSPANWSPETVPTDTAVFKGSAQTLIGFSQAAGSRIGALEFDAGAPAYTFCFGASSPSAPTLLIAGAGVSNASMSPQCFVVGATSASYLTPQLQFAGSACAGNANTYYCAGPATPQDAGGGVIRFVDSSSAGAAHFMAWTGAAAPPKSGSTVGGEISFGASASADRARFTLYGSLGSDGDTFGNAVFHDSSSAASAEFTNMGGMVSGGDGGNTQFYDAASAANARFHNHGGSVAQANGGDVAFDGGADGGAGHYYNYAAPAAGAYGGVTSFNNNPGQLTRPGASAGCGHYFNFGARGAERGGGGHVEFSARYGSPTAAKACFNNYGSEIAGNSSAGHTLFSINAPSRYAPTAGQAVFYNHPAAAAGGAAGYTEFAVYGQGQAGAAVPSAGQASFYNLGASIAGAQGGSTCFSGNSDAGQAILFAYGGVRGGAGGRIVFKDQSSGGTASVYLADNAELDLSAHQGGLSLANLDLAGGILALGLGGASPLLELSGALALRGTCRIAFASTGVVAGQSYALLSAPNLAEFAAAQFSGNPVDGLSPSFSIVGNCLQVVFA